MKTGKPWVSSLSSGFLAGLLAGELFLGIGLLRAGPDLLAMCPTRMLAAWLVVRSSGVYGLMFAAFGLALAGVLNGLSLVTGRGRWPVFALVSGAMVSLTVLAYLTVWWQFDVIAWLPLRSGERWAGALRHLAYALAAGLVAAGGLTWLSRRWQRTWARTRGHAFRAALKALALAVLLVASSEIGLAHLAPPGRPPPRGPDHVSPPTVPGRPGQVIVVGLDGLTFRVLAPLLRAGELPVFRRLLAEGAWGTVLTYGTASSPLVWTSMATGKRVREHGIDDFVRADAGYRARPLKSYDRRSRALWNVLSTLRRKVAVVNWLVTFPPEKVNGYVVSRLDVMEEKGTYPAELQAELEPLLSGIAAEDDSLRARVMSEIDRVFAVVHHLLRKDRLDLLLLHEHSPDTVQHTGWRHYQPEEFDPDVWPPEPASRPDAAALVPDVYRRLDRKLGELMQVMDADALLIVVSDHGQRPRLRPMVRWRMDRILARLGYSRTDGASGEVDYARSEAYALIETAYTPTLRININVKGRETFGLVEPDDAPALAARVIRDLAGLRSGGRALFEQVTEGAGHGSARASDILVVPSGVFLSEVVSDPAVRQRTISLGGHACSLAELLDVNTSITGDHDRQGVILLHGPGIRPGPIGQRVVTTAIQEVVWRLTDKVEQVDAVLPQLRRLGLIERATTLDIAPTVLYALGLPVARDMAGRPLTELFTGPPRVEWVATYEGGVGAPGEDEEAGSDAELLERLRALGYIN